MTNRHRIRREAALAQVSQDATYCVHYSSIREILNSQDLADRIARYPEGGLTHIEHLHQVPADTPQDPRNLWLRKQDPNTGPVTVSSADEDLWDLDVILFLPDGARPFEPGSELLDIYKAMVIRHRARHLSDRAMRPSPNTCYNVRVEQKMPVKGRCSNLQKDGIRHGPSPIVFLAFVIKIFIRNVLRNGKE